MPWNDYPLRSITIPADHDVGGAYTFIGNDDPIAALYLDTAIVFHFGAANSAFIMGVSANAGVSPDVGQFKLTGVSDEMVTALDVIELTWTPATETALIKFGDSNAFSTTVIAAYGDLIMQTADEADGTISMNGANCGYGVVATLQLTANSGAITAETVVATVAAHQYSPLRAYRVVIEGGWTAAGGATYCQAVLRKTNVAGAILGDLFRFPSAASGLVSAMYASRIFQVGAAAVTAALALTYQVPAGTVTRVGNAATPFLVTVEDCGPASDFPSAPVLS